MRRLLELSLLGLGCCVLQPAWSQETATQGQDRSRAVPVENVKIDYAQVLRVEPVFETLRATRTEERCDPPAPEPAKPAAADGQEPGVFTRMFDSVRNVFSHGDRGEHEAAPAAASPAPAKRNCRVVQVGREFQRPIAYDVDYVYKGTKYRSRLGEDPGNRLRVRVSVTPFDGDAAP